MHIPIILKNNTRNISKFEIEQTIYEFELEYGEICYKCEEYIGDPTGEPRLCENCIRNIKLQELC
jgi:hypothetical protein